MSLVNAKNLSETKVQDVQTRRDRRNTSLQKWLTVAVFVVSGMFVFFFFVLNHIDQSFRYSFYDWNGLGPLTDYQEFGNYERLFAHDIFK